MRAFDIRLPAGGLAECGRRSAKWTEGNGTDVLWLDCVTGPTMFATGARTDRGALQEAPEPSRFRTPANVGVQHRLCSWEDEFSE